MQTYNKIMQLFWTLVIVIVVGFTTYKGFKEGFNRWMAYYALAFLALLILIIRRFMTKKPIRVHPETEEE